MGEQPVTQGPVPNSPEDVSDFAKSYASFNRIVNTLRRQYLELKDDFAAQNAKLVDANKQVLYATGQNLVANEFLNGILRSMSVGVVAVDEAGLITHFNPAASLMLGIPARTVIRKPYRDHIPPGEPVEANALRTIESGRTSEGVEKTVRLVDGTQLTLAVSTSIIRDTTGKIVGALEVFHDLTKMKRMEQEISRLGTLAALGEMAATIAHEVRNPLAGISGFASLLKRDIPEDDPRQKLVDKILRGTTSLNQTVTTLLNYTRNDELNKERLHFGTFIHEAVDQFRHDHADRLQSVRMRVDNSKYPPSKPVVLWCDAVLLRQVLYNLLLNAVEACPSAGDVTISYRSLPRQTAVQNYSERVLLGLDETVAELTIADNGQGISTEARGRLFSPFFTTKKEGTGLGLATAIKIVKAHGGEIFGRNRESGGAEFIVVLPTCIDPSNGLAEEALESELEKER